MKFDMKWKVILVFAVAFGVLYLLSEDGNVNVSDPIPQATPTSAQTQNQNEGQQELQDAPLFTLKDLDGNSVALDDYKGKIVFVNFWATWCPPCRAEIPHFVKLIDKYGDQGFVILGISVDDPKDYQKIPGFKDKFDINYPILLDEQGKVGFQYGGIQSIPTTFVLNKEGKALGKIVGSRSYEQFEDIIKRFL
jgi:peroxiredoxin